MVSRLNNLEPESGRNLCNLIGSLQMRYLAIFTKYFHFPVIVVQVIYPVYKLLAKIKKTDVKHCQKCQERSVFLSFGTENTGKKCPSEKPDITRKCPTHDHLNNDFVLG